MAGEESIVNTLLDSLTDSLTQLVIKYESIAKDCDKIEQQTALLTGEIKDIDEIKSIVNKLRSKSEQVQSTLDNIIKILSDIRQELHDSTKVFSQKIEADVLVLNNIARDLKLLSQHTSTANDALSKAVGDIQQSIVPVSRLSELLRKPLAWVVAVLALTLVIWSLQSGIKATFEMFKDSPVRESSK